MLAESDSNARARLVCYSIRESLRKTDLAYLELGKDAICCGSCRGDSSAGNLIATGIGFRVSSLWSNFVGDRERWRKSIGSECGDEHILP